MSYSFLNVKFNLNITSLIIISAINTQLIKSIKCFVLSSWYESIKNFRFHALNCKTILGVAIILANFLYTIAQVLAKLPFTANIIHAFERETMQNHIDNLTIHKFNLLIYYYMYTMIILSN